MSMTMRPAIYVPLGVFIVLYLALLVLLNKIPRVTIRKFGWLSLYHVSIDLPMAKVSIRKIGVRLNFYKEKNSPFRFFHVEFTGLELEVIDPPAKEAAAATAEKELPTEDEEPNADDSQADANHDPFSHLSFSIPKKLIERFFIDKIANQVLVHFYKASVKLGDHHKYVGDYIRLENNMQMSGGTSKFVISMFNGYLQRINDDDDDSNHEFRLYRNVEFTVSCDTVSTCKINELDKFHIALSNFDVYLSLGKLNIPWNDIQKDLKLGSKSKGPAAEAAAAALPKQPKKPIPRKKLISKIRVLQSILDFLNGIEMKMEDFQVGINDFDVKISNFSTTVRNKERNVAKKSDFFNLSVNLVSAKIYHKSSKCFDLPSLNNSLDIDARTVLAALDRIKKDPFTCTQETNLDLRIDNKCMITNPTIDLYYDQIELVPFLPSGNKKKPAKSTQGGAGASHNWKILHFFSEVTTKLTLLDLDINLHIPPEGFDHFIRNSVSNNVITIHLSSFMHKATARNIKSPKATDNARSIVISHLFKFKNLRMNAIDNILELNKMNLMTCYNVVEHNASLRLYVNKAEVKSVNEAIFHMIRSVRNWSIVRYNKKYESLQNSAGAVEHVAESKRLSAENLANGIDNAEVQYLEIFEMMPSVISSIKVHITSLEADITCKDGLPSHIIEDDFGQKIDMADFSRGISIKILNSEFAIKVPKQEVSATVKSIQCFTLSEYDAEYSPEHDINGLLSADLNSDSDFSDVGSFDSNVFKGFVNPHSASSQKAKKVLQIRDVRICNTNDENDVNKLFLRIPEIDGRVTMFLVWCSLYAASLLKYFAPTVQKACSKQQMQDVGGATTKKLKLEVLVDSLALVVRLPNTVDILLEVDTLRASNIIGMRRVRFNTARGYVVHPATKLWTRLLVIMKSQLVINKEKGQHKSAGLINIESEGIRLSIPHQFLFYTVIDNVITFFKAIRQIQFNFQNLVKGMTEFEKISPFAKPAITFPHVRVKSKAFILTLDNDPFETELGYIFELGKLAQKERIRLQNIFDEECEKLRSESIETKIELTDTKTYKESPLRNEIPIEGEEDLPVLPDEVINKKIETAREEFNKTLGRNWIYKYSIFRKTKIENRREKISRLWREEPINKVMKSKFDIMNDSIGVSLFTIFFKDLDLEFDKVAPSIQDNLDDFIFNHAKGQPKQEYSILVPLFLSLKCRSMISFLKDYYLPVLSFPQRAEDDDESATFFLRGNIVINETLFKRPEELRHIFVPFSPIAPTDDYADTFYSVYIPRTLTPVKFVVDLECDIDTDRACMITWCKSYSAALSATMSALDNFTKPQIDDSPLGWWDKSALLLHGSFNCRVSNELCLHMKASIDPYDLIGKASGLVFSWKNNVHLKIDGSSGKQDELIVLQSDDFLLAIPNYSVQERKSWSMHTAAMDLGSDAGAAIDFESAEAKKYQKRIMKLSSDAKVKWKVGLLFERNADIHSNQLSSDQERVNDFKSHWDVEVTGPAYEYHPDSYEGFRSDYLHFAISVESKPLSSETSNCHNSVCLTPLTFKYFFSWWDLMTKYISLPIKQGPIFGSTGKDKSHVKMGPHLFTIKYQLILEPLTISHLYMHSTSDDKNNRIAFTGLKGKFKRCAIDLHQRKQALTYVNEKLNINNKVLHLKMNKGEVLIDDADIRVVSAVFAERSIAGYLASQLDHSNKSMSSDPNFSVHESSASSSNFSSSLLSDEWVDSDDFVELEQRDILSSNPRIQVFPFFYAPAFSYVREFSFTNGGKYPFGNELSHSCVLGSRRPEDIQKDLIQQRVDSLESQISAKQTLLKGHLELHRKHYNQQELKILNDKLDVVKALQQKVEEETEDLKRIRKHIENEQGEGAATENGENGDVLSINSEDSSKLSRFESLSKMGSKLSAYSSNKSEADMIKTRMMNMDAAHYHNRFVIHNMRLQWHNKLRNTFLDYIQKVSDRKSEEYFMSKKAVDLVESIIKESKLEEEKEDKEEEGDFESMDQKSASAEPASFNSCKDTEDVIAKFEEIISSTRSDQETEKNYLVKLIHPQIQLTSHKDRSSCVLISSRDLELRMLSINKKGMSDVISESGAVAGLIESRYGVLFNDSHVYVFHKDQENSNGKVKQGGIYSGTEVSDFKSDERKKWPPWVDFETCYESSWIQEELIIERNSMAIVYVKQNPLFATSNDDTLETVEEPVQLIESKAKTSTLKQKADTIDIHLAKVVLSATAVQYATIQTVVTNLLLQGNSRRDKVMERLEKVISLADSWEFEGFDKRIINLQQKIRYYQYIFLNLESRGIKLSKLEDQELSALEIELTRMKIELSVLMKGLRSRSMKQTGKRRISKTMNVFADQVILHLLKEEREPFLDFALAKSKYSQFNSYDGSSIHKVAVDMLQAFNLQNDAVYPELLRPLFDKPSNEPIVQVNWKMLQPVGGIGILERAKLSIQPLKVELDYETATALMSYMFPKSDSAAKGAEVNEDEGSESDEELDLDDNDDASSAHSSIFENSGESSPSSPRRSHNPFKRFIKKRINSNNSDAESLALTEVTSRASSDNSLASSSEKKSSNGTSTPRSGRSRRSRNVKTVSHEDDIAQILERGSTYMSILNLEISKMQLMISFKAPKHLNIIDLHQLIFTLPTIRYRDRLWSNEEAILKLRKDVIKIVISHSGKILGNKFKSRKRNIISKPLQQISDYASFMSVQDLQSEGRSRDSGKSKQAEHHLHPHAPHHHHHHHGLHSNHVVSNGDKPVDYEKYLISIAEDAKEEDDEDDDELEGEIEDDEESETDVTSSVFTNGDKPVDIKKKSPLSNEVSPSLTD